MKIRKLLLVVTICLVVLIGMLSANNLSANNQEPETFKENNTQIVPPKENASEKQAKQTGQEQPTEEVFINLDNLKNDSARTENKTNSTVSKEETTEKNNTATSKPYQEKNAPAGKPEQASGQGFPQAKESTKNDPIRTENKTTETYKFLLFKEGKTEIEADIPESTYNNLEIHKKEEYISKVKKQVIVSSESHVDNPLRVYSDILPESKKQEIKIYWENKGIDITNNEEFEVRYYDENNNNLIDRISWIVPHLSEQIFEIEINPSESTDSETPMITLITPLNDAEVSNPITFSFNIDYIGIESLNCDLMIYSSLKNYTIPVNTTGTITRSMPNGNYVWFVSCKNKTTGTVIRESTPNEFSVNEDISLNIPEIALSNKSIPLEITSNKNAYAKITLIKPLGEEEVLAENISVPINYTIPQDKIDQSGIYNITATFYHLAEPLSKYKSFTVSKAELSSQDTIEANKTLKLNISISSLNEEIIGYSLDWGDTQEESEMINQYSATRYLSHIYKNTGLRTITLTISTSKGKLYKTKTIQVNPDTNQFPSIELTYPEEGSIIESSSVTFSYSVGSGYDIDNCTFELYFYNNSNVGTLKETKTHANIQNPQEKSVAVNGLSQGEYDWFVTCQNEISNKTEGSYFDVIYSTESSTSDTSSGTQHERIGEIESTLSELNEFLEETKKDKDKEQILEDMGLSTELKFYQQKLGQIIRDLDKNIRYVKNPEEKEKELLEEFEEIKQDIPSKLEIIEEKEYVKNSLPKDFYEILEKYMENQNIKKGSMKSIADYNEDIQHNLMVSTTVKTFRITYNKTEKEITLFKKEFEIKNESFNTILEFIPESISEKGINFITKMTQSIENIHELKTNKLNGSIAYYVEELIDVEDSKKTETILFKEGLSKDSGITGFFAFDLGINQSPIYFFMLIILGGFLVYYSSSIATKFKIFTLRENHAVQKVLELVSDAQINIARGNSSSARASYHQLKQLYPELPPACKKYIYNEITKIKVDLDKNEIKSLIEEYEKAVKENRRQDALDFYKAIRKTYKDLPKKYQKKVYEKLFKDFNF